MIVAPVNDISGTEGLLRRITQQGVACLFQLIQYVGIDLLLRCIAGCDILGVMLQRFKIGINTPVRMIGYITEQVCQGKESIRFKYAADRNLCGVAAGTTRRDQLPGGGVAVEMDDLPEIVDRLIQAVPNTGGIAERDVITRLAGIGYLAQLLDKECRATQ